MNTRFLTAFFLVLILSCSSSRQNVYSEAESQNLLERLSNDPYVIELQWARPLTTAEMSRLYGSELMPAASQSGQINIMDSANYIKKLNDTVMLYLPYFGTRQLSVNPSDSNSAIRFVGIPETYAVNFNEKKQNHSIIMKLKTRTELLNVSIQVFNKDKVQVNINSSHRTSITYSGGIKYFAE